MSINFGTPLYSSIVLYSTLTVTTRIKYRSIFLNKFSKLLHLASCLLMLIFIWINREMVWQFYGITLVLYILVEELKIGENQKFSFNRKFRKRKFFCLTVVIVTILTRFNYF